MLGAPPSPSALQLARQDQEAKAQAARLQREALRNRRGEAAKARAETDASDRTTQPAHGARGHDEMEKVLQREVLEADAWSRILPPTPAEIKLRPSARFPVLRCLSCSIIDTSGCL